MAEKVSQKERLETEGLLKKLEEIWKSGRLSKEEIAEKLGISYNTFRKWFVEGKSRSFPSSHYRKKIRDFLSLRDKREEETLGEKLEEEEVKIVKRDQEAQKKSEKIKWLLLLLEDELSWFRNGDRNARDVFRKKLDVSDVGYIASLLTMLGEEDQFRRWCAFTTNRFNYFREKGGKK